MSVVKAVVITWRRAVPMRVAVLVVVASIMVGCGGQPAAGGKTPRDAIRRAHAALVAGHDEDLIGCYTGPAGFETLKASAAYTREAYAFEDRLDRVYGTDAMSKFRAIAARADWSAVPSVPPKDAAWIDELRIDESGDRARYFDPFVKTEVQLVKTNGGWKISLEGLTTDPKAQAEMLDGFTNVLKEVGAHAASGKTTLEELCGELARKSRKVLEGAG